MDDFELARNWWWGEWCGKERCGGMLSLFVFVGSPKTGVGFYKFSPDFGAIRRKIPNFVHFDRKKKKKENREDREQAEGPTGYPEKQTRISKEWVCWHNRQSKKDEAQSTEMLLECFFFSDMVMIGSAGKNTTGLRTAPRCSFFFLFFSLHNTKRCARSIALHVTPTVN